MACKQLLFHFLALSLLLVPTANGAEYVYTDNGWESDSYQDENSLTWYGDEDTTNQSITVSIPTDSIPKAMRTLRAFPNSNKKNCHRVDIDKGQKVLVRASFYYGNYDRKSSPPSFHLIFDANHWTEVETSMDEIVSYEIIYVTRREFVSVCFAKKFPDQIPFVSALEVQVLDLDMYGYVEPNYALMLSTRLACGAEEAIRYPSDEHDRIWNPATNSGGGLQTASNDGAIIISVTGIPENPPKEVLENAFESSNTSSSIELGSILPSGLPININMYFSEVMELESTQTRTLRVRVNGEDVSETFKPPYGRGGLSRFSNFTVPKGTSFALAATPGSTLPPLINALEVFIIIGPLSDGTFSDDEEGVSGWVKQFEKLEEYGDPCLPAPYTWNWVNCSKHATPRITALQLSSHGLAGELPDFSSMTALETIDLHDNSLEGPIPEFLGSLPSLKLLNLADNKFSGPVPSSLSNNPKLKLIVSGNSGLCSSDKKCKVESDGKKSSSDSSSNDDKTKSSKLPIILGIVVPVFIVFWVLAGIFIIMHQKRKSAALRNQNIQGQNGGTNMQMMNNNVGPNTMNEYRVDMKDQKHSEEEAIIHQQNDNED